MTSVPTTAADRADVLAELVAISARGDNSLLQFRSLASAHQYRGLHALWRRHVLGSAEVLDWGAGNGHFSYFLVRRGHRVTGFSFEPDDFTRWLPSAPPYRFVAGSEAEPVKLPFADRSFDAVASVGVLEHVRETGGSESASLAEIARVLRPGGTFVCWHFPNRWSWIDAAARRQPGKHFHVYRYTPGDIRRLVTGAGLQLLEHRRYGLLPRTSLHKLLGPLGTAPWTANAWDAIDTALGIPFGLAAQNHGFAARKPEAGKAP